MRSLNLACALVLLVACGGGSPPAPPETALAVAASSPPAAPVYLSAGRGWSDGALSIEQINHLGSRFVVIGGWRIELAQDGHDRVAGQALFSSIQDARRCGDGWVFLTSAGLIAYAETFTGDARRIGTIPASDPGHRRLRVHDGIVTWTENGLAVHGPCTGPMRRAEPVPGDQVQALWGGGQRRLAVVGGHDLFLSTDAGEHWQRLDIGDDAVDTRRDAFTPDGAFMVGETWKRVDDQGHLVEIPEPEYDSRNWDRAAQESDPIYQPRERATVALLSQRDAVRRGMRASQLWVSPDTFIARVSGAGLVRVTDGRVEAVEGSPEDYCGLRSFGPRLWVTCDESGLWTSDDGRGYAHVDVPEHLLRARIGAFSDDGQHVAFDRACERDADEHSACVLDVDAGALRTVALPADSGVAAMHGEQLLLTRHDYAAGADHTSWMILEPSGEVRPLDSASIPDSSSSRFSFAPDGSLWGIGYLSEGAQGVLVVLDPASSRIELRALPEGARSADLADGHWGVAAGLTTDALWTTADGGRSWTPLPNPFEAPLPLSRVPVSHAGERIDIECNAFGCAAGTLFIDHEPSPSTPARILGPGPLELAAAERALAAAPLRLTCTDLGTAESPWGRIGGWHVPYLFVSARPAEVRQAGLRWRTEPRRRGAQLRIAWSGEDDQGAFESRTDWIAASELGPDGGTRVRCAPIVFDRQRMVAACCGVPASDGEESDEEGAIEEPDEDAFADPPMQCAVSMLVRDGGARALPVDSIMIQDALVAGDDLVFMEHTAEDTRVTGVAPDGAVAWHRSFDWGQVGVSEDADDAAMHVVLARLDGRPALFRQLAATGMHTAHAQALSPLAAPVTVTLPEAGAPVPVCSDRARGLELTRGVQDVSWTDGEDRLRPFYQADLIADIALVDGHACVRSIRTPRHEWRTRVRLRGANSALEGTVDARDGTRHSVRCTTAPAEESSRGAHVPRDL